jgi:hypothetical protein
MPTTLSTVDAILKEIYEADVQYQLENRVKTLRRIEKTSEGVTSNVGGKYVVFPIHTRRNAGIGARREMENLPTPGNQGTASAQVGLAYLYGGVQMSGQTLKLVESNTQAFISALDLEMKGLKQDLAKDCNRQVYGDASGRIAVVASDASGVNSFVVVSTQYVQLGMKVDIISGTTLGNTNPTVIASNRTVTNIVKSTNTITLDGAVFTVDASDGDMIVRHGSVNREWHGLDVIVGESEFLGLDPADEPEWMSHIHGNSGVNRTLTELLMITLADDIYTSGAYPSVMFTNLGVRRAYYNLLKTDRRAVNVQEFKGGFSGLAFTTDNGDIPLVTDTDAPPNQITMLTEDEIKIYREGDWQWMDMDGSKWQRVEGKDAYTATMFQYSQIGTHRRNAHGRLEDLIEA